VTENWKFKYDGRKNETNFLPRSDIDSDNGYTCVVIMPLGLACVTSRSAIITGDKENFLFI